MSEKKPIPTRIDTPSTPSLTVDHLPSTDVKAIPYWRAATSDNTRRAYRSAVRQFERWGGLLPSNETQIIGYLQYQAQRINARSLSLHITALSQWHQFQQLPDPTQSPLVKKTLKGIRRVHGKPQQKAAALQWEHIERLHDYLKTQDDSLANCRNRALLLVGFFGAFRRSELVAIEAQHIEWQPQGVLIHIPRSKTDVHGEGMVRAIPYAPTSDHCPVLQLKTWLERWQAAQRANDGELNKAKTISITPEEHQPIFCAINRWGQLQNKALHPSAVNTLLKQWGKACLLPFVPQLSSHSLRRGMSTAAARAGADFAAIKKQGGWKRDATVWEYIEEGNRFNDNAAGHLMVSTQHLPKEEN